MFHFVEAKYSSLYHVCAAWLHGLHLCTLPMRLLMGYQQTGCNQQGAVPQCFPAHAGFTVWSNRQEPAKLPYW